MKLSSWIFRAVTVTCVAGATLMVGESACGQSTLPVSRSLPPSQPVAPPQPLAPPRPPIQMAVDPICWQLFKEYFVAGRGAKIPTETVYAVSHIIVERGRNSGFDRIILQELRKNDERSEIQCVKLLGQIVAIDAYARTDARRRRETGNDWPPQQRSIGGGLRIELVKELLARAQQADRASIGEYVIALTRARVPECQPFLKQILATAGRQNRFPPTVSENGRQKGVQPQGPPPLRYSAATQFHAAVGLALLADAEGIEWLIANCEKISHVQRARPVNMSRSGSQTVGACCVAALQQLSGNKKLTQKNEWEAWSTLR